MTRRVGLTAAVVALAAVVGFHVLLPTGLTLALCVCVLCATVWAACIAVSATRNLCVEGEGMPEGRVICVIPSFNEDSRVLWACVRSVVNGSVVPDKIIVVDDGSLVWTPPIICPGLIEWIRQENTGKRQAQINGLREELERGDAAFVVTMDSDATVGRHCIRDCLRAFNDERVQAATATVAVLNRKTNWLTRLTDLEIVSGCLVMRGVRSAFGAVAPTAGTCAVYRAGVLFDNVDDYLTSGTVGDDRRLTHYALLRGRVVAVESALVHTLMPTTLREMFQQRNRWFKSYFRYLPWELRHLSGAPLVFRMWGTVLAALYPVLLAWAFIVLPVAGGRFYWQALIYWVILMYAQTARYVAYERPDMTLWARLRAWLVLTPLLAPLNALVLRPAMYWGIRTARTTHWQTRGQAASRDPLAT